MSQLFFAAVVNVDARPTAVASAGNPVAMASNRAFGKPFGGRGQDKRRRPDKGPHRPAAENAHRLQRALSVASASPAVNSEPGGRLLGPDRRPAVEQQRSSRFCAVSRLAKRTVSPSGRLSGDAAHPVPLQGHGEKALDVSPHWG
ncbi:MAG: hypothetical protein R2932_50635 [Caldilineaceae bacterium]